MQAMVIEFRKAIIPDEIPALLHFVKKAFQAHPADLSSVEEWTRWESYWMIVDGKPIGCLAMETDNKNELWTASTGILPEYRRNGFGNKMKQWQIDYARSHGFPRVAGLMRKSNEPIIRLNTKFGFTPRPTRRRYFNPDEPGVEMELQLDVPSCPKCGKPLRTHRAKQCRFCGADWH